MRRALLLAPLLSVILTAALAAPGTARTPQFPDVEDSSFLAADGTRTLRLAITINAPPAVVWEALSTAEGWKRWAVKTAYVDFREGGQIETSYTEGKPKGDRDNIRNQIVAIVPGRLLVFRNVQAPRDFKDPELFAQVVTVIALEPEETGKTRVTISGAGFGGAPFDALYKGFSWGNAYSLVELKKSLEK